MLNPSWTRRDFLGLSMAGVASLAVPAAADPSPGSSSKSASAAPVAVPADSARSAPKPPPLDRDLVRDFVIAAHGNLDRTRELLGQEPGLLNATWDWKSGDFEAAIGGAGHMGRRDIAGFLIDQGARFDLFVAAMLGEIAVVRACLTAHPRLIDSKGPHGIPLIAHAKAGGKEAAEVLDYLTALKQG